MAEFIHDFQDLADALWSNGFRKIYISHYEDELLARKLGKKLQESGFEVTIAADARKLGREFVSKKIDDCDLTIVVNPQPSENDLIMQIGAATYNIKLS